MPFLCIFSGSTICMHFEVELTPLGGIFVHFYMLAILARLMLDGQYHLSTQCVVKQCVCHFISAVLHLIGFTSSTYFTSLLHG